MNRMKRSFKSAYTSVSELYSVFTIIPDVLVFTLTIDYNLVNLRIKEFIAKMLECEWNHSHIQSQGFQMCILLSLCERNLLNNTKYLQRKMVLPRVMSRLEASHLLYSLLNTVYTIQSDKYLLINSVKICDFLLYYFGKRNKFSHDAIDPMEICTSKLYKKSEQAELRKKGALGRDL